ncbi:MULTISPECIES: flagellar hook-associated protein 3 [Pseudomonas]|uniref:Flagellar hook-associated protein 3 n=1 Tax=Pseudomonas sp. Hg7Tf TaxID=3236988 RepID=A0AB39HWC9_9PSED|nr:flagellar hook-associated protein 3 [Pseudomonas sp. 5]KJK05662.1 flagellar hook protein FlgL [Pseudomonas sp. 5]MDH2559229.1 flagellar hook-associated protein 3 [Pseudomonas sp. Hg5Tf]
MRISTSQFYETSSSNYQRNFSNVVKTGQQASDNIRVRTAADDPVGAARLLQLQQQSNLLDQYNGNITSVRNSLGTAESTLNSISNVLARVKELAIGAGNGGYTDADRKANAQELTQLEEQLYSLMNSRDENGKYIFSGSRGDTPPYVRNADGTYTYQGDQSTLNLQVGDMLSMATNESGYSVFEQALNTSRSQTSLTSPAAADARVGLSNGQVSGSTAYNDHFRSGEPYVITFVSSTEFKITDATGAIDYTLEATGGGTFDPNNPSNVTFRGVEMQMNVNLREGDKADPDAAIAGHTFTLASKPDEVSGSRSPGNTSSAQITSAKISDSNVYHDAFPGGGAIIKFSSATNYEVYAQPMGPDARPVASGVLTGTPATKANIAGVEFDFSEVPSGGDQFSVKVDTHQTQNILDTISEFRKALATPVDDNQEARQKYQGALQSAIGNLESGANKVAEGISSIGARGAALDVQAETNESLKIANTKTQSSIRDADPAEVLIRLSLQQTMLQASQLAFSKISSLSLFNRL